MCLITCNQLQRPWHSKGSSHGTPMAPHMSPNPSPGWGLDHPLSDTSGFPQQPMLCTLPGPVLQGVQQSSLLHIGDLFSFISREQRISPALFSIFSVLSTICLYALYSVALYHCTFLDCILKIPGNIFSSLVFLLDTACPLPWYPLHISFWLFQDFLKK